MAGCLVPANGLLVRQLGVSPFFRRIVLPKHFSVSLGRRTIRRHPPSFWMAHTAHHRCSRGPLASFNAGRTAMMYFFAPIIGSNVVKLLDTDLDEVVKGAH